MCYEFVHACESRFTKEVAKLVGKDRYFLLCFGHLNYFYCNDFASVQLLHDLLQSKGIMLHGIEQEDMSEIIAAPFMKANHVFDGNVAMLEQFRKVPAAA